jgi:ABC-2 type transport system permease protein
MSEPNQGSTPFNFALVRKYISESTLLFVGLVLGVFSFCYFRVSVVGKLDTAQFQQIMDLLPKDWRKFSSVDFDWLVSYLGRTSFTLDEPMLILLISAWAIVRGSDVVSGELGRGTMEMFLAQPISRTRVFLHHAALTGIGVLILVLVAWLGMSIGLWNTNVEETRYPEILGFPVTFVGPKTAVVAELFGLPAGFLQPKTAKIPMSSEVDAIMFLPGIVNMFSLGFFLSAFSALVSSIDSFRWRTLGILSAFYFANAGIKILGMSLDESPWVVYCSIFGLYSPANSIELAQHNLFDALQWLRYDDAGEFVCSGPLLNNSVLIGLGFVCYLIGLRVFQKRDLPAPT